MLNDVLTIARSSLQRGVRSRAALVTAIAAPLALAVVFGNLIGGAASAASTFEVGVVDAGGTPLSGEITGAIIGSEAPDDVEGEAGALELIAVAPEDADAMVDDADVGAVVIVGPEGEVSVIGNDQRPISAQIAEAIAYDVAASVQSGGAPTATLGSLPLGGRDLSVMAYFGASMSGLLLFFTLGAGPRAMMEDRDNGTLRRMLSGPTSPGSIIGGKVLAVAVLGLIGFVVVWLVTTLVFGAEWGSPIGVVVTMVATVFAIGGVSLLVGSLSRTPQQAETYTTVVGFVLSLLGGAFVPPVDTPAALRALSRFTPNGLSLDAFTALNADAAGLADIAPSLTGLLLIGVLFGGGGAMLARRLVDV